MTYQWYANTTDSTTGGTAISGATQPSYTPPADEVGTLYYYCVVTNEDKTVNNTAVSETARVTVDPDPTPKAHDSQPGSPLSGYDWDTGYVYNVDDEANGADCHGHLRRGGRHLVLPLVFAATGVQF